MQTVFQHVNGVTEIVSGYAGGTTVDSSYEQVSTCATGHAEAVRVTFDPASVSYPTLLRILFSFALDLGEVNRQEPDTRKLYRSELFVAGPEQDRVAHAYVAQLAGSSSGRPRPIPARAMHRYIGMQKVEALRQLFPQFWRDTPAAVGSLAHR